MTHSIALLVVALTPALAAEPPNLEERARALVAAAAKDDFAVAATDFDAAMTKAMPADKFSETWKGLVKQVGVPKKQGKATAEKVQKYDVVWVACEFEKATLYTRVVFDGEGRVTGLSFRAFGPAGAYKAPAYVKPDSFTESAKHLNPFTKLRSLNLDTRDARITDAALPHLKHLTELEYLDLDRTGITDAGLEHVTALRNLRGIQFAFTEVGDAGLEHLHVLSNLREVNARGTKVTKAGVDRLKQRLPDIRIGFGPAVK